MIAAAATAVQPPDSLLRYQAGLNFVQMKFAWESSVA